MFLMVDKCRIRPDSKNVRLKQAYFTLFLTYPFRQVTGDICSMANTKNICVFLVDDDPVFSMMLKKAIEQAGDFYNVTTFDTGKSILDAIHLNPDILLLDYHLPDVNGIEILSRVKSYNPSIFTLVISGQEKVEVVVDAYNQGADKYILKNDKSIIEVIKSLATISENIALRQEVEQLRDQIIDRNRYDLIIGESKPILKVLKLIQKVEKSNILVLITGESGTGKDVVARTIHYHSPRKRKPFVAVNVAAIPEDLIESELFGHEKGAFTGAITRRIGKFEEANEGTIFLDEIGEMDMNLQTKLLRVLQDSKVIRLGSNKEIQLDIRVIAATNKNLMQRVKEGKFREDLFYRLQGFLIHLPGLKERDNDIILLANRFLSDFCKHNRMPDKVLDKQAIQLLLQHDWPGNVRELKSVIERSALISDNQYISEDDILFAT